VLLFYAILLNLYPCKHPKKTPAIVVRGGAKVGHVFAGSSKSGN
jgi:hypothetical protein